jgi:hypothetical protein
MNIIESLKKDWFLYIFTAGITCIVIGLVDGLVLGIDPFHSFFVFYGGLIIALVSALVKIAQIDLRDNCI